MTMNFTCESYITFESSYAYALMMICVVVNVNDGVNLVVDHYDNAVTKLHTVSIWQKSYNGFIFSWQ